MAPAELPLIMEPETLQRRIGRAGLLVADLSNPHRYTQYHIPGAIHINYSDIALHRPPVLGLLPDAGQLSKTLSAIGFTSSRHVVACDDEGGGRAARFLWTLEMIGHRRYSLLNGGLNAWLDEDYPINNLIATPAPSDYQASIQGQDAADRGYILAHLDDPSVVIVDARSPAEYQGTDRRAARAGHIPGAVNIEWNRALDPRHGMRLCREDELRRLYESAGVTPDKQVIVYCHSHHRSALTWFALKSLGYPRVKGYPGSWSDWGNNPAMPVADRDSVSMASSGQGMGASPPVL